MHGSDAVRPASFQRWVLGALLMTIVSAGPVRAQATVDPDLQDRILQRSDGALFIYKDGLKFPVEVAGVDDDFINSVPDGDVPVTQLDQLIAPPAPVVDTPAPAPPPSAPGPLPPQPVPPPYVAVANPVPGDNLIAGGLDIQGKAFDPAASPDQGTGIDRVQVFLGDRDRGGLHLADARLGLPNTAAAPGSQFALAGWDVVVNLPPGSHTLFIYGRSTVTGKEGTVQVPIRVGSGA
jgi:hypothetical protein